MQVYLVANGVAYQVLRVANKMPVACVTFCICCTIFSVQCTGIFFEGGFRYRHTCMYLLDLHLCLGKISNVWPICFGWMG